jgi:hypothetical protein
MAELMSIINEQEIQERAKLPSFLTLFNNIVPVTLFN